MMSMQKFKVKGQMSKIKVTEVKTNLAASGP